MYASEPKTIGGVLDAGFALYRTGFREVTVTAAKGFALVLFFEVLMELIFGVSTASVGNVMDPEGALPADMLAYLGYLPVYMVVMIATFAAVALHLHRIASGADDAGRGIYGAGLRRLPAYVGTIILYFLVVFLGMLLLFLPGMWAMVAFLFSYYVVVTEKLGPFRSMSRSYQLVKGNWWRTATVFTVAMIVVMIIQSAVVTVPAFVTGFLAASGEEISTTWFLVLNFLSAVGQTLSVPLLTAMILTLIHDLSLRRSGEDLEARLEAAGS
jgi:hypothetical protein